MLDSCLVFLFAISPPASQVQTLTGKYAHSIWERPILRRVFCELSTESLSICLYTYVCGGACCGTHSDQVLAYDPEPKPLAYEGGFSRDPLGTDRRI